MNENSLKSLLGHHSHLGPRDGLHEVNANLLVHSAVVASSHIADDLPPLDYWLWSVCPEELRRFCEP